MSCVPSVWAGSPISSFIGGLSSLVTLNEAVLIELINFLPASNLLSEGMT